MPELTLQELEKIVYTIRMNKHIDLVCFAYKLGSFCVCAQPIRDDVTM